MSVEDRLRNGLARNAASFEPDTESTLERVVSRTRRRSHRRWLVVGFAGAGAAAAAVVGFVLVQRPRDEIRTRGGAGADDRRDRAGGAGPDRTVRGDRRRRSDGELPFDIAGRWVIELDADGSMQVTAPDTYTGVVSAPLFQATPEWFRTSLFEQDLCSGQPSGTYRWELTGSTLQFTEVDDPCDGRVAVLAATGVVEDFLNRCQPPRSVGSVNEAPHHCEGGHHAQRRCRTCWDSAARDQRVRERRNRRHRCRGRRFDAPGRTTPLRRPCATGVPSTIPDGTYSRVVVREDAIAAGFDPELVDKHLEADGKLPMAIKVAGDRWTHFVTTDSGIAEIGDAGTASYDDEVIGSW